MAFEEERLYQAAVKTRDAMFAALEAEDWRMVRELEAKMNIEIQALPLKYPYRQSEPDVIERLLARVSAVETHLKAAEERIAALERKVAFRDAVNPIGGWS